MYLSNDEINLINRKLQHYCNAYVQCTLDNVDTSSAWIFIGYNRVWLITPDSFGDNKQGPKYFIQYSRAKCTDYFQVKQRKRGVRNTDGTHKFWKDWYGFEPECTKVVQMYMLWERFSFIFLNFHTEHWKCRIDFRVLGFGASFQRCCSATEKMKIHRNSLSTVHIVYSLNSFFFFSEWTVRQLAFLLRINIIAISPCL